MRPRSLWRAAVAAGLVLLVVARPTLVTGTLSSPTAALRVGALVAAAALVSWLLRRFVPRPVGPVLAAAPWVVVLLLVVVPVFVSTQAQQDFDDLAEAGAATSPTANSAPSATGAASPSPDAMDPRPSAPPPVASEPVQLSSGELRGIGHDATGAASLYRLPDGQIALRLEDIDIEPGPDYDVYLVPTADAAEPDGGTLLGDLEANRGTLVIAVPDGVAPGSEVTVLIWCTAFAVPIASAPQVPA